MAHWFRRYCYICGDAAGGGDGTHCRRHAAFTNRPSNTPARHCGWCGRAENADDGEECVHCREEENSVAARMSRMADDLNARSSSAAPEWHWSNCPHCGLYTVCLRGKPGILESLLGSYAKRYLVCGYCNKKFEKDI